MQLETLKLFCDAVRLRSISRGASESGVTQSAASQAIEAGGTGEAEALLCGDEFESSPRQLGKV